MQSTSEPASPEAIGGKPICCSQGCANEAFFKDHTQSKFWTYTAYYCVECYGKLISRLHRSTIRLDRERIAMQPRGGKPQGVFKTPVL